MALPTALLVKGVVAASTVALGGVAIFKREDIYYFFKQNDNRELNDKIKALGISGCELENKQTKKENCTLSNKQLKDVKFSDKSGAEVKVTEDNKTLTLTIEKGYDTSDFPEGLRFTLKNTQDADLDIGTDSNNKITLKKNIDYDFKIKEENKLEKAWTLETLAEKVGISCTSDTDSECSLTTEKINAWKNDDYVTGAKVSDSPKIKVEKDSEGYREGFKFYVENDTNLTEGTKKTGGNGVEKLIKKDTNNTYYEIDLKEADGTKKWFLVEKSTTGS